tara:strand:- start:378 stop:524 length:147 start_codon:yes stop_codon:yes gene_type:complete
MIKINEDHDDDTIKIMIIARMVRIRMVTMISMITIIERGIGHCKGEKK